VGLCPEHDLDPVFLEDLLDAGGNVRVFVGEQLIVALHHGDVAAEAAEHLRELETDVAASENQQMLRDVRQLHDGGRIERRDLVEALESGAGRPAAAVDEYEIGVEALPAAAVQRAADGDLA
jgi:hypothetical protein